MTRRRRQAGFTLLELLVALSVFGFLVLGLAQGIRLGLTAWNAQARTTAASAELDAADRTLRGLIARIDPGVEPRPSGFVGRPDGVTFITELPEAAGAVATRRARVTLGVAAGQLVLRWTPEPKAQLLGPPPPVQEAVLLERVARIELAYARGIGGRGGWTDSWSDPVPPALVRLRVVPADGRRDRWPEILAAPMRTRP